MKYAFAFAALLAAFAVNPMAQAGSIPEGCVQVKANWVTAPTYSCPIVDTNNENVPFCDKPGLSWQQKKERGCIKCGSEHSPKA